MNVDGGLAFSQLLFFWQKPTLIAYCFVILLLFAVLCQMQTYLKRRRLRWVKHVHTLSVSVYEFSSDLQDEVRACVLRVQ